MLGSVLDVLYASLTSPTPSAAASTMVRMSPVTRETRVATAMVPAARRMPRLAPGAPSRSSASSSDSPAVRGTGGRAVISCVSLATGTQRFRAAGSGGSGGGGRGRAWGRGGGGRPPAMGRASWPVGTSWPSGAEFAASPKGADGGGAARYGGGGSGARLEAGPVPGGGGAGRGGSV